MSLRSELQTFLSAFSHQQAGRHELAEAQYREVLAAAPGNANAWNNLGIVLRSQGRFTEAIEAVRQAIAIRPDFAAAHANLGNSLKAVGHFADAIAAFHEALRLDPAIHVARFNLANTLRAAGRLDESIGEYSELVKQRPEFADGQNNLGRALERAGRIEESLDAYQRAVELEPNVAGFHANLGNALRSMGRFKEAEQAQNRASAIDPDFHDARWNLAMTLLLQGDFKNGWPAFEARRHVPALGCPIAFPDRLWHGDDLHGKKILLDAEQGFGDTLQFVRYVPKVIAMGGNTLLRCHRALHRLLDRQCGIGQLLAPDESLPEFESYCPLPSLPGVFGTTLGSIPGPAPYLSADTSLTGVWAMRIAKESSELRVGLAWAGSALHAADRARSIPAGYLTPLARVADVRYFSVQKALPGMSAPPGPAGFPMIDHTRFIHDFADTAAFLTNLDLVITVDTAVAHLAGALGKQAWVLLPFAPDWRWMLGRADSPWYPSLRLFRQTAPGNWTEPIQQIVDELASLVRHGATRR